MDTRNGNLYPSREAAQQAGVPDEHIVEVEPELVTVTSGPFKGWRYRRTAPVPAGHARVGTQVLTDHIRGCSQHPMCQLETENAQLRHALVGLVGVETRGELEAMEAFIRLTPAPAEDKAQILDAIHLLRDTLPEVSP